MVSLTTPQSNPEKIEVVNEFCTGVIAGMVAKEAVGRSPFTNEGLEGP